ncbi:hypothetical protein IKG24_01700 [Candidatus Saccharibacteria bacterium]|nr:hypothetical protein [Candidatus Saccharibacteria bacterium]
MAQKNKKRKSKNDFDEYIPGIVMLAIGIICILSLYLFTPGIILLMGGIFWMIQKARNNKNSKTNADKEQTTFQKTCNAIAMILAIIGIVLIFGGACEIFIVNIMSGGKFSYAPPELIAGIVCLILTAILVIVKKTSQKSSQTKNRKKS